MINLKITAALLTAGLAAFGGGTYVEHQDTVATHAAALQREINVAQEKSKEHKASFMESHSRTSSTESGIVVLESDAFQQYSPYEGIFAEDEEEASSSVVDNYFLALPHTYGYGPMHIAPAGTRGIFMASSPYTFAVTNPSNTTSYELDTALADTGLAGLGNAYVVAEQLYGINALFLAAVTALESGWGDSPIARAKNNIGGYGAYDASPFESAWTFRSRDDCIMQIAKSISKEYVNPTGAYYNGNTIAAINIRYSTSSTWKDKVFRIMNELSAKINRLP